ncbi:MAG: aldehyde dehydrogenase family protein [Flavobacteriales bacterium]|nr:aldehyde dehydrogenase family protein [Flavobacteriales bacterium]MCB9175127.1 aldehyde dehydrogenase family protein [Flavobacteriales bacterium]
MLKVFSPYNQELIKEIPLNTVEDVERALHKATAVFNDKQNWMPAFQRVAILERVVEIMTSREDYLADLATKEGGKPLMDSKVEVLRAINGVKIAAQTINQLHGEEIPMGLTPSSTNRISFTTKEPIGVVVAISAFNHPLNLIVHQVATAIAAGCPVIVKPALTTPLSCIEFVEILKEAGLPRDWCQLIICEDELAEKLATDTRVNYLTFIGSAKVGWYLRSKIAPGTRIALEHGGVAPVIVEQDADVAELIPAIVKGGFYHAGQVCVSVQRVFVHEQFLDKFLPLLVKATNNTKVGNPLDEKTQVGPLILPTEVDRVEAWVNEAINEGAELLCGGKRISSSCFEPTVLLNPNKNSKVSVQEIFGPVICIYTYKKIEEAINQANALSFAFQAAVFTKNIDKAFSISKQLNAAAVMINDHTAFRVDWMPFGGRKSSGIGVGGIQYTINEMLQDKLLVIKTN